MNTVVFTPAKVKRLRRAYEAAVAAKVEHFRFEDNILLTSYAQLMLEYLDMKLGKE